MSKKRRVEQIVLTEQKPKPQSELEAEIEKLKADLAKQQAQPKERKARVFQGFKIRLKANFESVAVEVECRYEKLTSKALEAKRQIVHKHISGIVVFNKPTPYHWTWMDETGKEYPETEIKHYEVIDGKETEVAVFERSKDLTIEKTIPITEVDSFLAESEYELWAENTPALWKLAKYLLDKDLAAIAKFTFGKGFKEYWAVIYPHQREGKWGLVMVLTMMRKTYKHLMNNSEALAKPETTGVARKATSILETI